MRGRDESSQQPLVGRCDRELCHGGNYRHKCTISRTGQLGVGQRYLDSAPIQYHANFEGTSGSSHHCRSTETEPAQIYYFDEDLYLTALPLIKISILLTYLRVFTSKKFKIGVYIVIGLNLAYGIAFLLVSIFQCLPIHCAWTRWDGSDPTCEAMIPKLRLGYRS